MKLAKHGWNFHPHLNRDRSLGEQAADLMRNGMGSWVFVFSAVGFLALWMIFNGHYGFDPFPFILLNLILSCVAALQGAILLIADKRQDQISSELALHDYQVDKSSLQFQVHIAAVLLEVCKHLGVELSDDQAAALQHPEGLPSTFSLEGKL